MPWYPSNPFVVLRERIDHQLEREDNGEHHHRRDGGSQRRRPKSYKMEVDEREIGLIEVDRAKGGTEADDDENGEGDIASKGLQGEIQRPVTANWTRSGVEEMEFLIANESSTLRTKNVSSDL